MNLASIPTWSYLGAVITTAICEHCSFRARPVHAPGGRAFRDRARRCGPRCGVPADGPRDHRDGPAAPRRGDDGRRSHLRAGAPCRRRCPSSPPSLRQWLIRAVAGLLKPAGYATASVPTSAVAQTRHGRRRSVGRTRCSARRDRPCGHDRRVLVDGCPGAPEFAESSAGEPAFSWKFSFDGFENIGSASTPCGSLPVAATNAASDEYCVPAQSTMTPGVERCTRSKSRAVVAADASSTLMFPSVRGLSIPEIVHADVVGEGDAAP